MRKIFFALTASLFAFSGFAQNTNKLIDNYTTVKNALVNGDSKAAAQAASVFQKTLLEESSFEQKNALQKSAGEIAEAGNIEKQRSLFGELSVDLWKVVKSSGKSNQPLYYDYCPMKKAYWISEIKEIKNPYYGSSMLTCGKIVESK